jgi:hypothetical protein
MQSMVTTHAFGLRHAPVCVSKDRVDFALYSPATVEHVADVSQAEAADIGDVFITATAAQERW